MKLAEDPKISAVVNDLRIKGIPEHTVKETIDRMFPAVSPVQEKKSAVKTRGYGGNPGNNVNFREFFHRENGFSVEDFTLSINWKNPEKKAPVDMASDAVDKALNVTLEWLKGRSDRGTMTWEQNAAFSDYITAVAHGGNKDSAKAKCIGALAHLANGYKVFNTRAPHAIGTNWIKQVPTLIEMLKALNWL